MSRKGINCRGVESKNDVNSEHEEEVGENEGKKHSCEMEFAFYGITWWEKNIEEMRK